MPHKTRGRSYAEFNLAQMPVQKLTEHIKTCHDTELSCRGSKSRRYWKQHKDEAQAELDARLEAQHHASN